MLFSLPAIVSQLQVDFIVFSNTVFYCEQDVSLLRSARNTNTTVFYCEQDVSLLRSARNTNTTVFYCEQDVSLLRSARNTNATVFYCEQDVISMTESTVTIYPIATDNIIQPPEEKNLVISGNVTNVYDNTIATILINNITYTTSIISNLFNYTVPLADIASWGSSETVTVSVVKNGETYSATSTLSFDLTELSFTPQKIILPLSPSVALYLKGDGLNGDPVVDDSGNNHIVYSSPSATYISNVSSMYGGSSIFMLFTNTFNYPIEIPSAFAQFTSTSDPFCIEFWEYRYSNAARYAMVQTTNLKFEEVSDTSIVLTVNNTQYFASVVNPNQVWKHIAITYTGSTFVVYFNGIAKITINATLSAPLNSSGSLYIGQYNSDFEGYLDSFRITHNSPVYTSNFDPLVDTSLIY